MESVNKKISCELVKVQIKDKLSEQIPATVLILEAVIRCPFCSTTVTASHTLTGTNNFSWTLPNFKLHLELAHLNQTEKSNNEEGDISVSCDKLSERNFCKKLLRDDYAATPMPTPCYSGSFRENNKDQSYSKILKDGCLKFDSKKIIPDFQEPMNSNSLDNHLESSVETMTKGLPGK